MTTQRYDAVDADVSAFPERALMSWAIVLLACSLSASLAFVCCALVAAGREPEH